MSNGKQGIKLTSFDQCWHEISVKLTPKLRLNNWSAAEGAEGSFKIAGVTDQGVTVRTGKGSERLVSRKDFSSIFEVWPDCRDGSLQRHKLRSISVNSSTTVVDRRSVMVSLVYGSGSGEHGIDVLFAIWTSAADDQRRASLARAGA
jgi:hypothetical protein